MVTGRGLGRQEAAQAPAGDPGQGGGGAAGSLMVSGVKRGGQEQGGPAAATGAGFEFPGFTSSAAQRPAEEGNSALRKANGQDEGMSIDIPFDI